MVILAGEADEGAGDDVVNWNYRCQGGIDCIMTREAGGRNAVDVAKRRNLAVEISEAVVKL